MTKFKNILLLKFFIALITLNCQDTTIIKSRNDWEIFPIINYDTDVGIGYGLKGFFYNYLSSEESFDLILYNSTKGERWYRLVYSIPDMQRRQRKKYDLAFDLIIDYDKWINYSYYYNDGDPHLNGGDDRKYENYIREPIEICAIFSRAFNEELIADLGIKYKSISCYDFDISGKLQHYEPSSVQHMSIVSSFRIDTRSNFLAPQKGVLLKIENELAMDIINGEQSFYRIGLTIQSFFIIMDTGVVLASRLMLQALTKTSYQNLISFGGNNSIRGLPQDRYPSLSAFIFNEELRFPIFWRFGGVLGVDIGNCETLNNWIFNPVVGLRFNMDNFIVRADLGFGSESTGIYFNFGHIF